MSNGTFQKGTWIQLPSNCTRDYVLTFARCVEYGTTFITECLYYIQVVVQQCLQWIWQFAQSCLSWVPQCCSWWPCSWACAVIVGLVCIVMAIVVSLICIVVAFIAFLICAAVFILEYIFCILWSFVEIIGCMSSANGGTAFLLTDGTLMVQECKSMFGGSWPTPRWWKLTPDQSGSYANGTWSQMASSGDARKYFASAVLADGRVLVCGGEYSSLSGQIYPADEDNTCTIYDPVADAWSVVPTPTTSSGATWQQIGDAPCTLLPDGKFLMGSINDGNVAKLDPSTLTWTTMNARSTRSDEESWVLMPNDTIAAPSCSGSPGTTFVYDITSDVWNPGNTLPIPIVDVNSETGPALLRYDGTAFFLGANQHTAMFSGNANPQWSNGPDLPAQNGKNIGVVDGPAALLVNGNVLFGAGPINANGDFIGPCFYFEFDGTMFNRTNDPPNNGCPTYPTRLLLLPNGDVMFCREDDSSFYAYHSDAAVPQDSFRPVIATCPANLVPGTTIQISGLQFNGLSQAVAYGDDSQTATNYPLVRIQNNQTNHIRYCRTFNHTSMGVATGQTLVTTSVVIPADIETGAGSLVVVANGIPSLPFAVTISPELD